MDNPTESKSNALIGPVLLFQKTWELYRARFLPLLGIILLPFLGFFVLGLLVAIMGGVLVFVGAAIKGPALILVYILVGLIGLAFFVVLIGVQFWSQVAMVLALDSKDLGVVDAYKKAWPKILSFLWVALLVSFVVIGGYMLFFIPGLIVSLWLIVAAYVVVLEDKKGMKALVRSKMYVEGRWWPVFGRWLLLVIAMMVVVYVPVTIFQLIDAEALGALITNLLSFLISPFAAAYIYTLYKDLKSTKVIDESEENAQKAKKPMLIIGFVGNGLLLILLLFGFLAPLLALSRL